MSYKLPSCASKLGLQQAKLILSTRNSFASPLFVRHKGHSHWQNVKSSKEMGDRLKSMTIGRFCRRAKILVRDGGADLKLNAPLDRLIVEAVNNNVPKDTLMKAIATAASKPILTLYFEYKGPGASYFIIEALGENRNFLLYALKGRLFKVPGGFNMNDKTVRSYFEHVGVLHVLKDSKPPGEILEAAKKSAWNAPPPIQYPPPLTFEDAETLAIEINAQSVSEITDQQDRPAFEIVCEPDHVARIEKELNSRHYAVVKAGQEFRPYSLVTLSAQHMTYVDQFYAALDGMEEIEAIYDNVLYESDE